MMGKTKLKIASLISAIAGLLVYPRTSAAWNSMPAPDSTSQQSAQRASPQTAQATLSVNNVSEFVGVVHGQKAQAGFRNWANQNLGAGATNMTLLQLMNYISFRNQQGGPGR